MTSRERRIQWITDNTSWQERSRKYGQLFDKHGFDWFTDEQIEDMTAMLAAEWRRMNRNKIRNRHLARKAEEASRRRADGGNV